MQRMWILKCLGSIVLIEVEMLGNGSDIVFVLYHTDANMSGCFFGNEFVFRRTRSQYLRLIFSHARK